MIRLEALTKVFKTEEVESTVLNSLDLTINTGEFVAIMGPSGCGKSTLLNVLGLLDSHTQGDFFFLDQNVSGFSDRERTEQRKVSIGFVFQSFNLINTLTVSENIELPLKYQRMAADQRRTRVDELLDRFAIAHRRNHFPKQLSGGQQQRTAVARAVVAKPPLILADEPTGNLDSSNGSDVMDLLKSLNESGTTIVMVTHSSHDARYAGRVLQMADGKLAA